jgi:hypothetical protein
MATYTQFFFDGLNFISCENIYTTAALTTVAADGWYSQNGVYRQMVNGVLGAAVSCPDCQIPCGSPITASGQSGIYRATFEFGISTGAAIITFNPGIGATAQNPVPSKMTWTFDGQSASEYSSYLGGYSQGYIGSPDACVCCQDCNVTVLGAGGLTVASGSNGNSFSNVDIYDFTNGAFQQVPGITGNIPSWQGNNSGEQTLQVCGASTVPLIGYAPFNSTMVVPVPVSATATTVSIEVIAPCVSSTFSFEVLCPVLLNSFSASNVGASELAVCDEAKPNTFYNAGINTKGNSLRPVGQGGAIAPTPATQVGLHDWVFTDAYGVNPLAAGFYSINNLINGATTQNYIRVSSDGIVIFIDNCPNCLNNIFISGLQATCEAFCDGTNRTIPSSRQTTTCDSYVSLQVGDVFTGATITNGWYAYAATSTNTASGTYRQMRITTGNVVADIKQCAGTACVTP